MVVIITAPSLDVSKNVSGMSSVTRFIIKNNKDYNYIHFEIGKKDQEKRNIFWFWRLVKLLWMWILLLVRNKNSIIHYNIGLQKASILRDPIFILWASLLKIKMVIHLHGGEYLISKNKPWWVKMILRRVFSSRCPIIVLSDYEKQIVEKEYCRNNIYLLPNCVEYPKNPSYQRNYNKGMLTIVFIGRISDGKGLPDIMDALQLLQNKKIPFLFKLAGQGNLRNEYLDKFSRLLKNDFEYLGIIDGDKKNILLQESDVFLLPSAYEGLPMALLESMSYGNVPVVTPVGTMGQVIKNYQNGLIVSKGDPESIANALELLYNDRVFFKKLSINARSYIYENYKPQVYIEELNSIYHEATLETFK